MRRLLLALAIALVGFAAPGAALAEVSVIYSGPKDVSPLVYRSVSERDALVREIARTLRVAGDKLPKGQKLAVELLDVRPAGQFEPWRPSADTVRILRDVTPPSVRLRYALTERGRAISRGEETVTDMNYLWSAAARSSLSSFPYERELMRDWFRDRIVRGKPPLR